jgi:uncharacterized protein
MSLDNLRDGSGFTVAIRDPVWKHVWLTQELFEITKTEAFLRLGGIKQLGPTEFVYPGATHTRAAHSVGVYHLAYRALNALLSRGADSWVTEAGCRSFLAAALLHDAGHFPFTHSLKDLPLREHESLTASLILSEPLKGAVAATGADPYMAAAIVDESLDDPTRGGEISFFRGILSGVLDPDKLDYLNRDAFYCGVPYGIQDTDFILSQIQPDRERGIVVSSRAILSIESVLFSKYLMYRSVYWHRQVRVATAMMKKAVLAALDARLIVPEDLYSKDDRGLYALIASLDYPEKDIASMSLARKPYRVIAEFRPRETVDVPRGIDSVRARFNAERAIAAFASGELGRAIDPARILVDKPEHISFESDLYITDEGRPFSESSTVFTRPVVGSFTESLRPTPVAGHPGDYEAFAAIPDLGEKLAKCIEVGYTQVN